MRLYYHPASPYARKAYVAVLHRGDPVELRLVDVPGGELKSPTFLLISPFGKLPVLDTAAGPLIESTSIVELLEEGGPRVLLPEGSARLARHFDRLADQYLIESLGVMWFRAGTEEAAQAAETVVKAWTLFENALHHHPFVAGDTFTLGDIGGAIATDLLERMGIVPPPSVRLWRERCFAIPAMAQAQAEAAPLARAYVMARLKGRGGE